MTRHEKHCKFCFHHEDFHEFGRDSRTPVQTAVRKFECTDCDLCRREHVDAT